MVHVSKLMPLTAILKGERGQFLNCIQDSMDPEKINSLLSWGKQHAVIVPRGIQFVFQQNKGFCGVLTDEFDREESIRLVLPNDLIIKEDLSAAVFGEHGTPWLKLLLARLLFPIPLEDEEEEEGEEENASPSSVLVKQLREKFSPYLKCLPRVVDSPLMWNPAELCLLGKTNLGSSIHDKLRSIFDEWFALSEKPSSGIKVNPLEERLHHEFQSVSHTTIYDEIIFPEPSNWYSFSAYLRAHLIFTSRAFPEYVINPECDSQSSVMLLPIIDLLNHKNNIQVEWSTDTSGSFIYKNLQESSELSIGDELFNNYGPKSNEELLYGYGFVIESNKYDSVMLRIKLPLPTIEMIQQTEPQIKLPLLEDYTTFAFEITKHGNSYSTQDNGKHLRSATDYEDGLIYMLNTNNMESHLELLIDIFGFLQRHQEIGERYDSLRARLDGMQRLRDALKMKLEGVKQEPVITVGNSNEITKYQVSEYRRFCAQTYRESQIAILEHALRTLKNMVKTVMKNYKSSFLTVDKLLKHDRTFSEELAIMFKGGLNAEDVDSSDIEFQSNLEVLVTWLLCKNRFGTYPSKYDWVRLLVQGFTSQLDTTEDSDETSEIRRFYNRAFQDLHDPVPLPEVARTYQFVSLHTFTLLSTSEVVLVNHQDLTLR